jgi:hypothetical protein
LIPYVFAAMAGATAGGPTSGYFIACCIFTVIVMFGLGAWTSIFTSSTWQKAGAFMALNGIIASIASYIIGAFVGQWVE